MIDTLKGIVAGVQHYLGLIVAAGLGLLVLTLQARGRKIHRLQVELLEKTLDEKERRADEAVDVALERYNKAKRAYEDAGGKL